MSTVFERPSFKDKYDNFIDGKFVAPTKGTYFDVESPMDGKVFTKAARSTAEDMALAVDAAETAFATWSKTSAAERSIILNKVADVIEANLNDLSIVETIDNGKPIRETMGADLGLVVEHFRYFAGVILAEEGSFNELNSTMTSVIVHEPIGVCAQVIAWNFPLVLAAWKLAPALAAGNACVLKPAEQTPVSILVLMDLIKDIVPAGVINVVNGFGAEVGEALITNPKVAKVSFTGSTATGRIIMNYATENIIPVTLELGGKSPNIFFESIMDKDDAFFDKAIEGAVMFAFNQGEVCTSPSRLLIQESIYDKFIERIIERTNAIKIGNPLDLSTMMGAQASKAQYEKILSYLKLGKEEGAELLCGGDAVKLDGFGDGYYIKPTIFKGTNDMRIFQEEIFGPVLAVTTFKDEAEAIKIANETVYGLAAGVWTRDAHQAYTVPKAIQAGRVFVNQYHAYPAGAPFGGYKLSGVGRENHKMMLDHYRQTKNILTSFSKDKNGFF